MAEMKNVDSDWARCVAFHGHECPGLAIGFQAAQAGLAWIEAIRAKDEDIVAIVENDACGVDAVQVLTGCTFGKGNLIHLDHGKQVFTFFNRDKNRGARFSLRAGAITSDDRYHNLMLRVRDGQATPKEQSELTEHYANTMKTILSKSVEELFVVSEPMFSLPDKARIQQSSLCPICGEPTMAEKMVDIDGRHLCRPCANTMAC